MANLTTLDDIKHLLADIRSNVKLDEGLSYRVEDAISILETGYSAFHRLPEPIEDAPAPGVVEALEGILAGYSLSKLSLQESVEKILALQPTPQEADPEDLRVQDTYWTMRKHWPVEAAAWWRLRALLPKGEAGSLPVASEGPDRLPGGHNPGHQTTEVGEAGAAPMEGGDRG